MAEKGKERDFQAELKEEQDKLREHIKHTIMVISGKGGVGKSTVSANLAYALNSFGKDVGLVDADIHGPTIPKLLGMENVKLNSTPEGKILPAIVPPGLKVISMAFLVPDSDAPIIWRGPMKYNAIKQFLQDAQWGNIEYLIVDLPPGTGDESISIAQLTGADGSIIVTTPQSVALLNSRKAVGFAQKMSIPIIGIIENMSGFICPHCGERVDIFGEGGGERTAEEFGLPFLGRIPLDKKICDGGEAGRPMIIDNDNSDNIDIFKDLAEKVIKFYE
ncbi:MAG: antiporter inner membrane protein [Candidatus Methanolliviera sp. GoM_asphalt]|nr:MAG: antiporter inner membrane protein [Candidatus Methanolliviera sp. GoM_asphalt]